MITRNLTMGLIIKIFLLWGLIKLLIETRSPLLCAGIYTGVVIVFAMISSLSFSALLLVTALSFALAFVYFWILDKVYGYTIAFWLIGIAGAVIAVI
jgi:hypothetical protein